VWASLYFPSHRPDPPPPPTDPPPGELVGQRDRLCGKYLARDDLAYLFGESRDLIETRTEYLGITDSCWFFDVGQDRFTLKIDIASIGDTGFASQVKYMRTIPGAVVEKNGVGSIYSDGKSAEAIVRGSRYYVVISLRQGSMSFDKVKRILQMANKFSAALPQPTSGPRGTAPKKGSQK
jgi:hypothetical protein